MVREKAVREAWVEILSDEELRAQIPPDANYPYDFGFFPAMARLIRAHGRIGQAFGALYAQIMFVPGHLDRREREMVAAVVSAGQDCHY